MNVGTVCKNFTEYIHGIVQGQDLASMYKNTPVFFMCVGGVRQWKQQLITAMYKYTAVWILIN